MNARDTALARSSGGISAEQVLAVTAHSAGNYVQIARDGLRLLEELHGARHLPDDARCKTCRTSRGKPEPWPCTTYERFAHLLGVPVASGTREMFRTMGRFLNGQATIEDVNRAIGAVDVDDPQPPVSAAGLSQ